MASMMTENGFAVAAAGAIIVVSMVSCCSSGKEEESTAVPDARKKKVTTDTEEVPTTKKGKAKTAQTTEKNEKGAQSKKAKQKTTDSSKQASEASSSKKKRNKKKGEDVKSVAKAEHPKDDVQEDEGDDNDSDSQIQTSSSPSQTRSSSKSVKQPQVEPGWTAATSKREKKTKEKAIDTAPSSTEEDVATSVPTPVSVSTEVDVGPTKPSTTVTVDPKKIGAVIGPKGATMKHIEEVSGCKLRTIDRDPDVQAKSAQIHVEGPDVESVREACRLVTELCSKGYSVKLQGGDFIEAFVEVNSRNIPDLVGSGGVVVKALRDGCGVIVNLPAQKKLASGVEKMVKVVIAGPKANVATAQAAINDIMTKYYSAVTHPGFTHREFSVEDWQIARFCGKAGSNIRHIQGDSKARVYIPRDNNDSVKKVLVVGTSKQVSIASKHVIGILENIKEQANRVSSEEAFASSHRASKAEDDDEPHEEWMDEYLYKR